MKPDAYWKELYDNASASEYYEERWKDADSDLSTARDQLAEMRGVLKSARAVIHPCDYPYTIGQIDRVLSAAPAGGRVLCRNGWAILMYTDKGDTYTMIELAGPALEGFTEDGEEIIATIRKAPSPSADKE